MRPTTCRATLLVLALAPSLLWAAPGERLAGRWELLPGKSADIDLWNSLSLELRPGAPGSDSVTVIQTWGRGRSFSDTLALAVGRGDDGAVNRVAIVDRVWPTNVFMGLKAPVGRQRQIRAAWEGDDVLRLQETAPVLGSQGQRTIVSTHTYRFSPPQGTLIYTVERDTRPGAPLRYELKPEGSRHAYLMRPRNDWSLDGGLPENAFLISLQGVANTAGPRLYFIYPDWPFTYTPDVYDFYQNERNYTFQELGTPQAALAALADSVRGYVVWDDSVRTSLIVAFTIAGVERAVVVDAALIPMVEAAGLVPVADLRGTFAGMSDAEIYRWAYERYWDRCSKDLIIWMGGVSGRNMEPGVADWGIYNKAFFTDLSSRPQDADEYALADRLLGELEPMSLVMGWHSYAKDKEREHLTLTSRHGHRVEGLNTLPNMSFSHQVPATPGFVYANHHHVEPGRTYKPEKKVYIACVQTDGLGLGAWNKPGRGDIPYAWETIMNYRWLAPAMMEFFYSQATPNDYFIGALSGPGYLYPKAVPADRLPGLIAEADRLMRQLDIRVFEIMDYSEGATVEGNTELTRRVVDAYYEGMPDALGFINGYAPAFTFAVRDGKPLISYDYYLSPTRPLAQAAADLRELAAINARRPYFLLMHVRENSDIERVKDILGRLPDDFELVPLDLFLKMAGQQPTYVERYLEP